MDWDAVRDNFLAEIRELADVQIHDACYRIHDYVDALCSSDSWLALDDLLSYVDPHTDNIDVILSFIVATSPVPKGYLKNRDRIYDESAYRLKPEVTTPGVWENLK